MPRNSTTMIRTARQEFDQLLDSLCAQAAAGTTAYQVERDLFAQLLALGRRLLEVFFALCAERSGRQQVRSTDGTPLRVHSWKPRRYVSLFGELEIERPYFWARGQSGQFPMDAAVSLPGDLYSDLLREHANLMSAKMAYGQTAAVIEHLLGLSLSTSVLKRLVERDGREVAAFYSEAPSCAAPRGEAPSRKALVRTEAPFHPEAPFHTEAPFHPEAPVLVVQADGKGVPMRASTHSSSGKHPGKQEDCSPDRPPPDRSPIRLGKGQKRTKKKEAVVTSLYATERRVRTAEEVLDSFFSPPDASSGNASSGNASSGNEPQRKETRDKKVWATLKGKEVAFQRLAEQVRKRDGPSSNRPSSNRPSTRDRVALSDGCKALQDRFREHFPRFELILDFVHVTEYLWKAANALFEETSEARLEWVIDRSRELLTGRHEAVLALLREGSAHPKDACSQTARYFERNAERMQYKRYLAKGWPIATGVIEGTCRHLVKDRCETSGMRWKAEGAEQVLALRAVWTNGDWEAYHERRREQRHRRLYGRPLETTDTLEKQMWRMAA